MTAPAPGERRWRDVDGILLLDKPPGLSSNAALQRVRHAYAARKAGHTGSLDPLASGLLPVCLGQATKAAAYLLGADKTYRVRIALGERTATGDAEGEILESSPVPELSREAVAGAASRFQGEIAQVPPMYSALKQGGERLYRLARRGIVVERPARRVTIHALEVIDFDERRIELEARCSKGTYIRSLAEDFARALGTVGHVASLRRIALGPFEEPAMHELDAVERAGRDLADAWLLPTEQALASYAHVTLDTVREAALLHGQAVPASGPAGELVQIRGPDGRLLGMGRMDERGERVAPDRLMVPIPGTTAERA